MRVELPIVENAPLILSNTIHTPIIAIHDMPMVCMGMIESIGNSVIEQEAIPLSVAATTVPISSGVYAIHIDGELKYVGVSTRSIRVRMQLYFKKFTKAGYDLSRIMIKYVTLPGPVAKAVEEHLIRTLDPELNGTGIGNNQPGTVREGHGPSEFMRMFYDNLADAA